MSLIKFLSSKSALTQIHQWSDEQGLSYANTRETPDKLRLYKGSSQEGFKLAIGSPSRPTIHGMELRAKINILLPSDTHIVVVPRAIREKVITQSFDALSDDLNTRVVLDVSSEDQMITLLGEVRTENKQFRDSFCLLSNQSAISQYWLTQELIELFCAPSMHAILNHSTPFELFVSENTAKIFWQIKHIGLDYVEAAYNILLTSAKSAYATSQQSFIPE